MPFIDLGEGSWAHVRMSPPRRRFCKFCKRSVFGNDGRLCDFSFGLKICSAFMCPRCATSINGLDFCPDHKHQQPAQGALAL